MTLLAAGQHVVRVPTRLMAGARRAGRDRGKSDPIDAETLALAALRHPDLPVASLNGASREVKALSYFRRDLMRQRTQVCNKIRWYLHEASPAAWSTGSPSSWTASMVSGPGRLASRWPAAPTSTGRTPAGRASCRLWSGS